MNKDTWVKEQVYNRGSGWGLMVFYGVIVAAFLVLPIFM